MQYKIDIDQKMLVEKYPNVNYKQAAVLDHLVKFMFSGNMETIEFKNETYYWISYKNVSKQLPLVKISPDLAYRYIKHFCDISILKPYPYNQQKNKAYFARAKRFFGLISLKTTYGENPEHLRDLKREPTGKIPDLLCNNDYNNNDKASVESLPDVNIKIGEVYGRQKEVEKMNAQILDDKVFCDLVMKGQNIIPETLKRALELFSHEYLLDEHRFLPKLSGYKSHFRNWLLYKADKLRTGEKKFKRGETDTVNKPYKLPAHLKGRLKG